MKAAVMGYGTIGSGVVEVLNINHDSIAKRAGEAIEVKYVLDLRDFPGDPIQDKIVHDYKVIAEDPEIGMVVETMGGVEPAYTFVRAMLEAGKHVTTSNKALVAEKGAELIALAKEKNVNFLFEASVGGGIPIIRPLNSCLTADVIEEITGILNGTTNYMLTKMSVEGSEFADVLKDAQDAGIRVILFDRTIDADESLYEASIVSDMAKEGQTAVDWLKGQGLSEYKIIHLQGVMGSAAQQGRSGALDEAVASDGWTLVTQQTAEWNAEKAQQIVQSVIDSGESFNVIYAENDDMAKGAVAALDKANISHGVGKDVIVMGFDCNKWALEELLNQNWNYDGQCNPFQASYIDEIIKTLESGGTISEKTIIMEEKGFDAASITQEDVDKYGI